jgi:riboflavin synthase
MFSGIIETIGTIISMTAVNGCKQLTIAPHASLNDLHIGDSISVNGVCLTVTHLLNDSFNVTAVPETLRLTNLNNIVITDNVNLERALTLNTRIGGHYVQGHIDVMGEILDIKYDNSDAVLVKIGIPERIEKYIIPKGYITLNGMSITVIHTTNQWFTVTFIPHTQLVTTIKHYQIGEMINIEVDIIGKYIEKLLGVHAHANSN